MGPEGIVTIPEAIEPPLDEFGSRPDAYMMEHFGLTSEEGRQYVEFGEYKGTLAEMLSLTPATANGKVCPVGGRMREAHSEGGIEEVAKVLEGAKLMGAKLDITISQKTREDYILVGAPEPKKKVMTNPPH